MITVDQFERWLAEQIVCALCGRDMTDLCGAPDRKPLEMAKDCKRRRPLP